MWHSQKKFYQRNMMKMHGANTSALYIFKAYDYNFWSILYKLFTSSVKILAFIWELFKFFLSGKNYHISFSYPQNYLSSHCKMSASIRMCNWKGCRDAHSCLCVILHFAVFCNIKHYIIRFYITCNKLILYYIVFVIYMYHKARNTLAICKAFVSRDSVGWN